MLRSALLLFLCVFATAVMAAPPRAVVFDFELIDTSLTGEMRGVNKEETARLAKLAPVLREKLAASGRYEIVDLGPEEAAAKAANLQACGGCDVAIAKKLDADLSITGTVQKVSELILNINIYMRDVKTGRLTDAYSVDIRDNTDQSWLRGLDYLIRNRLLTSSEKPAPEKATQ
ncbi:DUF3280 domain-containing protein [Methyloferula stellata]|uniref:DUF3280 domain-containing protein n=1 Tax=Methyloferula stellata TaxID=876270 RepID=UPI0003639DC2|nr:DUF3280 domain-containing protein [Methyloferula stellata]